MNINAQSLTISSAHVAQGALNYDRPLLMGILNVTPDSFSDGGKFDSVPKAVAQAQSMIADGADIIDIGGESTRPGATLVTVEEEMQRVIPIVESIRSRSEVTISIDTTKSIVAREALNNGADIINDISAGLFDSEMIPLIADSQAGYLLMHMRGTPQTMQNNPTYDDVVTEVCDFLQERLDCCLKAGIKSEHLLLDPGIGFGKSVAHNLTLLSNLNRLTKLGPPVVIGVSRKSFIPTLTNETSGSNGKGCSNRLGGSLAAALFAVEQGAKVIRVHDVRETAQALTVMLSLRKPTSKRKDEPH